MPAASSPHRRFIARTISQWGGLGGVLLWNGTAGLTAVAALTALVALPSRLTRGASTPGIASGAERLGDLGEDHRIVDRRRRDVLLTVGDLFIVPRRILPTGLGQGA